MGYCFSCLSDPSQRDSERQALLSHDHCAEEEQSTTGTGFDHPPLPSCHSGTPSLTYNSPQPPLNTPDPQAPFPSHITSFKSPQPPIIASSVHDYSVGQPARSLVAGFQSGFDELERDLRQNREAITIAHEDVSNVATQFQKFSQRGKFCTMLSPRFLLS